MEWVVVTYLAGILISVWAVLPIAREVGVRPWAMFALGMMWPCILLFAVMAGVAGAVAATWRGEDV